MYSKKIKNKSNINYKTQFKHTKLNKKLLFILGKLYYFSAGVNKLTNYLDKNSLNVLIL